jgi:hypothetical protein
MGKVVALFDFTGDNDKKISFKRGDTISVLQKLQDEGWWEGELNGQLGLFPSNYVKPVNLPFPPMAAAAAASVAASASAVAAASAASSAPPPVASAAGRPSLLDTRRNSFAQVSQQQAPAWMCSVAVP